MRKEFLDSLPPLFADIEKELSSSSEKYRDYFVSSKEALGAITEEYQEVSEDLRRLKMSDGKIHNDNYAEVSDHLKAELIQLATMSLKAVYSLCDKDSLDTVCGSSCNKQILPPPPPLRTKRDSLSGLFS